MRIDSGLDTAYIPEHVSLWRVFIPPSLITLTCIFIDYEVNYLVFHTLAELISIFIGLTATTVAVTTTQFTKNQYAVFISLAAGWYACIDIAHTLAFKGMNLLPQGGGNMSTQLWVSARFFQALSFLFAVYFFRHVIKIWILNIIFFFITLAIFIAVFTGYFPTTYIEGYGVTWFKFYFEIVIALVLSVALFFLWREKKMVSKELFFYMNLSIILMICSDLILADYKNLFGINNLIGHVLKIFSFWFIYIALVVQTLRHPFAMLSRAATTYDNIPDPTFIVQSDSTISQANSAAGISAQLRPEMLVGLSSHMLFHNKLLEKEQCPACSQLPISKDRFIVEIETEEKEWIECSMSPIKSDLFPNSWVQVLRNITTRKTLENERNKLTNNLRERVKELRCLYTISKLVALKDIKIKELLAQTVKILPSAFQFPNYVAAKIESPWGEFFSNQKADVLPYKLEKIFQSNNDFIVKMSVYYFKAPASEPHFLPEESSLLDSVATLLKNTITRFLSEQKATQAEKKFMESEAHFRLFIEQAHFGVYVRNKKRFLYVNPRFCQLVGRSEEELLSLGLLDIVEDKATKDLVLEHWKLLDSGEHSVAYNLPLKRNNDGTELILRIITTVISWNGQFEFLTIADDITQIQHAREEIDQYVSQLESAIKGTFLAVSNMVELRDPYTAGHERRVGLIAKAIGEELGWPPERCRSLELIGIVHDIGKISVPAEILSKPTSLNEYELGLIKMHPQAGYEILKDASFKDPVAEVILQHHERLDGSGYPRGLKGKEILPETLVISVADVLEAMTSHRPYRPALGSEAAIGEIKRGSGIIYDTEVVNAVLRLWDANKLPFVRDKNE